MLSKTNLGMIKFKTSAIRHYLMSRHGLQEDGEGETEGGRNSTRGQYCIGSS
jgi:hypothetical protein